MYLYLHLSTYHCTCTILKYYIKKCDVLVLILKDFCQSTCTLLKYFSKYFAPTLVYSMCVQYVCTVCVYTCICTCMCTEATLIFIFPLPQVSFFLSFFLSFFRSTSPIKSCTKYMYVCNVYSICV